MPVAMGLHALISFLCLMTLTTISHAQSPTPISDPPLTGQQRLTCHPNTRSIRPQDCARAIVTFPMSPAVGEFYNQGPSHDTSPFKLPKFAGFGSCQVTVDLALDARGGVMGSWQEVWTMANTLGTGCTYWRDKNDATSAVKAGNIVVGGLMVGIGYPVMAVGNASGVATE